MNLVPDPVGTLSANSIPLSAYNPPVPVASEGPVSYTFADWLLTSRPGLFGLLGGCANPTGVALMAILTVMFVCSMTWVRKGGYFEVSKIFKIFRFFQIFQKF